MYCAIYYNLSYNDTVLYIVICTVLYYAIYYNVYCYNWFIASLQCICRVFSVPSLRLCAIFTAAAPYNNGVYYIVLQFHTGVLYYCISQLGVLYYIATVTVVLNYIVVKKTAVLSGTWFLRQ